MHNKLLYLYIYTLDEYTKRQIATKDTSSDDMQQGMRIFFLIKYDRLARLNESILFL